VRVQADFHSALVICVSRSQNPIQSANDSPPPPGVLGADSLELPDDSAMLGCTTPPVENCVCSCGESGAMGASSGAGAAISAGGVGGGGSGVGMIPIPEFIKSEAAAVDPVFLGAAPGACIIWGLPTIAGCLAAPAERERIPPLRAE
jgi:hypothetical protein